MLFFTALLEKTILAAIESINSSFVVVDLTQTDIAFVETKEIITIFDEEMFQINFVKTLASVKFEVCQTALPVSYY